ncbi:MAG: histidine phosphotransferase [Hyphomicrobiales bacterium]|nr:histidine phosphotransferase [Hyphomicrobiales bacterium]MBV9519402.1 histidine phosphotransferase [Hyphomicrobiales bacterium]
MTDIKLESLDLAALLCSRVCHDVISPVGAIVNGLEVMDLEKDEAMRADALKLVRESAARASSRLQFARLAFGAAGSTGASIDLSAAQAIARTYFNDEKAELVWDAPRLFLPKNKVKLLLNLLLLAGPSIPRGGTIKVVVQGTEDAITISITAKGPNARIPPHAPDLLAGRSPSGGMDAHAIQPYYTGLIARAAGMQISVAIEGETVRFDARSLATRN